MGQANTTSEARGPAADDYLDLVRRFPLRPFKSEAEYDAGVDVAMTFAMRDEESLSAGEEDYLDALTAFIEMYDDAHHSLDVDPLAMIRELMDQRGTTVTSLGDLFGGEGVASEILSGARPLTLGHIRSLATHFGVRPAVFVGD